MLLHKLVMHVSEELVLLSPDRLGPVAVVKRADGLFCLYQWCHWDVETQKRFNVEPVEDRVWSVGFEPSIYKDKEPLDGLYGTSQDAEREALRLLALSGS